METCWLNHASPGSDVSVWTASRQSEEARRPQRRRPADQSGQEDRPFMWLCAFSDLLFFKNAIPCDPIRPRRVLGFHQGCFEFLSQSPQPGSTRLVLPFIGQPKDNTGLFRPFAVLRSLQYLLTYSQVCLCPGPPAGAREEYREAQRQEENDLLLQNREEQRRKGEHLEEKQRRLEEEKRKLKWNTDGLILLSWTEYCCGLQVPGPTLGATLSSGATLTPDLADGTEEAGSDRDWVVMKLINDFPFCERDFLEDIVDQCDGDYQRAYSLLQ
ncbi:hypothetical protein ANANG_G00272140 [Anguilla anguilla]|uniref:CUE domain-containing protein n=1 Tax=Anguilla anguilla TaxID=7936 RepID=A0A9D3LLA0_ANGAN|nr:hypothetical protein ANANG_G00272140 [Anguilla anguilla]